MSTLSQKSRNMPSGNMDIVLFTGCVFTGCVFNESSVIRNMGHFLQVCVSL